MLWHFNLVLINIHFILSTQRKDAATDPLGAADKLLLSIRAGVHKSIEDAADAAKKSAEADNAKLTKEVKILKENGRQLVECYKKERVRQSCGNYRYSSLDSHVTMHVSTCGTITSDDSRCCSSHQKQETRKEGC